MSWSQFCKKIYRRQLFRALERLKAQNFRKNRYLPKRRPQTHMTITHYTPSPLFTIWILFIKCRFGLDGGEAHGFFHEASKALKVSAKGLILALRRRRNAKNKPEARRGLNFANHKKISRRGLTQNFFGFAKFSKMMNMFRNFENNLKYEIFHYRGI